MAYPEVSTQTLHALPAPESPAIPFAQDVDPYRSSAIAPVTVPQADLESSEYSPPTGVGRRIAAVAFAAGCLALAGEQPAEAVPLYVVANAEPQGSGINWALMITVATAAVGAITGVEALRRQTTQKRHERFIDALRDVAGSSDAAQLQARINILAIYAEDPLHQPDVFTTAVQSLRARRAIIIELRESLEGEDLAERLNLLDRSLAKRRNADREMLGLLTQTRQAALEQQQATLRTKRGIIRYIGRVIRRSALNDTEQDKLRALRAVTGLESTRNRQLVNAAGINLDLMRDTVADCDLSRMDLTGAGLQGNNFENVVFEGCNFGEAQLEGTTMIGCDLSGANFQAAYLSGDSDAPYFMGSTIFQNCIIDENTQFGHRPDNHPKACHYSNDPDRPQAYRGGGTIILRDLRSHQRADGTPVLSDDEIIAIVQEWRKNGLDLDPRSDAKYLAPLGQT